MNRRRRSLVAAAALSLSCAAAHAPAPPAAAADLRAELRVCLMRDAAVSDAAAARAERAVAELAPAVIRSEAVWVREDRRPAAADLVADLETIAVPMLETCDRVLAVVSEEGGFVSADSLIGYAAADGVRGQIVRMLDCETAYPAPECLSDWAARGSQPTPVW